MAFNKGYFQKKIITVQGRNFVLVPREQLRFSLHGRSFGSPAYLKDLASATVPTPPATWSGSKNRAIKYPVLGNDNYGDCYYADPAHCVQTWTGNVGAEAQFDEKQLIQRYLQISGGDNGLSDSDIFPEWKAGIVGPNGPHKILDEMTVDPADDAKIRLGMWLFCGASWTCSLPDRWINIAAPGAIWDADRPNPANGHAMHLSGYGVNYESETWGFDPAIQLTPAGLKSADPEVTLQFSMEMFNAAGIAPHNGMDYATLAALWQQLGGAPLPPSPFPPGPGPTPVPPPPTGGDYVITIPSGLAPGSYTVGDGSGLSADDVTALQAAQEAIGTVLANADKETIPSGWLRDKDVAAQIAIAMERQGHAAEYAKIAGHRRAHTVLMILLHSRLQKDAEGRKLLAEYKAGALPPGWLQGLLDWFIKNGPALLALIITIMKLFGL